MKLFRRDFLSLSATAALVGLSTVANAQVYPTRPVRLIVGFPPGGPTDLSARLITERLSEQLGEQFIVENRPGAGSNIGTEEVAKSFADGYTLLLITTSNAINATLYNKLEFNFIRDIIPIASISRYGFIMVVNPSVPAKTVPEFITYAKANPGKINMGSGGIGTPFHIAGELFKMMTGVEIVHVPYRGSAPMLADLLGGRVQVAFDAISSTVGYIKDGRLRALAVTTTTRSEVLPDIPTVGEFIPGYEASGWNGIGAPKKTPDKIVDKLNREIRRVLADHKLKARFAELGATTLALSPTEFRRFITEEMKKWAKVVKFSGVKLD